MTVLGWQSRKARCDSGEKEGFKVACLIQLRFDFMSLDDEKFKE